MNYPSNATNHQFIVSPLFQIIFFIISLTSFFSIVYYRFYNFLPIDKIPQPIIMTPKKIIEFGTTPSVVQVGICITRFGEFDLFKNNFEFSGIVWFETDPEIVSIDTLGKFSFENGEMLERSEPYTRTIGNKLLVRYNVRVHFNLDIQYREFPFDDHRISLLLTNYALSPQEAIFESSVKNFSVMPNMISLGWENVGQHSKTGYSEIITDYSDQRKTIYKPLAVFVIDYSRRSMRKAIILLLPLFLLLFLALFTFSLNPHRFSDIIITIPAGTITGMLAYRFVIDNLSPNVGYFLISDYLYLLFLLMNIIILLISFISLSATYKKLVIITFHSILIIASWYLTV